MIPLSLALTMFFTPPSPGDTIQIRINRNIAEVGRQEVIATTYLPNGDVAPCTCKYVSPSLEIHELTGLEAGAQHRVEVVGMYDPASVSVEFYVLPEFVYHLNHLFFKSSPGFYYTVQKSSNFKHWSKANGNFVEQSWPDVGWRSFPIDWGRNQRYYRVEVSR